MRGLLESRRMANGRAIGDSGQAIPPPRHQIIVSGLLPSTGLLTPGTVLLRVAFLQLTPPLCRQRDATCHPSEYRGVEREQCPPIQPAEQSPRDEAGFLSELGALVGWFDDPSQPGDAGDFHFGLECEDVLVWVDFHDAKEVEGFTRSQLFGMSPPTA